MKLRITSLVAVTTVVAAPLALSGSADAATAYTWTQVDAGTTHPTGGAHALSLGGNEASTALAWQGGSNVLAFGGDITGTDNNETWLWDGTGWTQQSPVDSPDARGYAAMAQNNDGTTLLYGGIQHDIGGTSLSDTWSWDGSDWTEKSTSLTGAGLFPVMSENPAGSGPVMVQTASPNDETFEWGASGWTLTDQTTPLPQLYWPSIGYDPITQTVYLFGGFTEPGGPVQYSNTIYAWDDANTEWDDVTPPVGFANPDARGQASFAYDDVTKTMILFGGHNANGELDDTWSWDGSSWTQISPVTKPAAMSGAHMVTDTGGPLLYDGGVGGSYATWRWGKAPDITKPFINLTGPQATFTLSKATTVTYTGQDNSGGSGIANYDVRYERAPYNSTFGSWQYPTAWQHTTSKSQTLTLTPGYEYCFSARARDKAGNVSGWANPLCTSKPLDDKSLTASSGWTRHKDLRYYQSTFTSTKTKGAKLSKKVAANQLALVVEKCPTCGSIRLKIGSTTVKSWSLASSTTKRKVLLVPSTFSARVGTVTVTVTSSGKTVQIDGLGVRRI